jgi:hypothetical protein
MEQVRRSCPAGLKKKILQAGLPQVKYVATETFYFVLPGGQVVGLVPNAGG